MWRRRPLEVTLLAAAKARLDELDFYPEPVSLRRVRVLHTPWLFRVPGFRHFRGYEAGPLILLTMPLERAPQALITHELCHVWQHQHRPVRMWLSYCNGSYRDNPYEIEARYAAGQQR